MFNRIKNLFKVKAKSKTDSESNGEEKILMNAIKDAVNTAVIFDVGANKGDYSALAFQLAEQSNKAIEIHVFEPQKFNFDLLKERFPATYPFIYLNNVALSNNTGSLPIYTDSIGSSLGSLYKRNLFYEQGYPINEEIIELTTLASYINSKKINKIDLLKIDVEGHELKVIQGLGELLNSSTFTISRIQFEYGGTFLDSNTKLKDIFDLLSQKYKLGKVTDKTIKYIKFKNELEDFKYVNYIAILKEN